MSAPHANGPAPTGQGFGRLLVAGYAVFAISATARAGYQLAVKGHEAPLAYGLSACAAVVYIIATVALAWPSPAMRAVAWSAVIIESVGVVGVGVLSFVDRAAFADATVWSGFGRGYGYLPLLLPFVALAWLWRTRPAPVPAGRGEQRGPGEPGGAP